MILNFNVPHAYRYKIDLKCHATSINTTSAFVNATLMRANVIVSPAWQVATCKTFRQCRTFTDFATNSSAAHNAKQIVSWTNTVSSSYRAYVYANYVRCKHVMHTWKGANAPVPHGDRLT